MKYLEVGATFTDNNVKLYVKKSKSGCDSCHYEERCARGVKKSKSEPFHLYCMGAYRPDKKSVKFCKSPIEL